MTRRRGSIRLGTGSPREGRSRPATGPAGTGVEECIDRDVAGSVARWNEGPGALDHLEGSLQLIPRRALHLFRPTSDGIGSHPVQPA